MKYSSPVAIPLDVQVKGICIIKKVHLCMPCIPAADIKVIVELNLKAEPLPGNGWGGLRLISIEDQPRPRQQFLAIGEIFSGHHLLLLVIGFYK